MIWDALILLWIACSIGLGAIGTVAILRAIRTARQVPSLRSGVGLAEAAPVAERVCAIVPAYNEEDAIGAVLGSLRAQRGVDLRMVVAMDRCTDRTRERAIEAIDGDARFELLDVGACPEGWAGKVNALWHAAQTSEAARSADLLLFLDADVTMDPDCLRAAGALRRERNLGMVTLLSTLRHRHWFERLVQPACVIELAYEFPPLRANRTSNRRAFVNGQFVMVRREDYDRLGGHAAVAGEIMEDFALARLTADAGLAVGVFPADGLLVAAMYDSWDAFVRGWTRIFVAGSGRKVSRLRKWSMRLALACAILPVAVVAGGVIPAVADGASGWLRAVGAGAAIVATGLWGGLVFWMYAKQRAPWWSAAVNPLGFAITAWIMWRSASGLAARRPIAWAGRSYVFEPR